jgi:hypothetical protein
LRTWYCNQSELVGGWWFKTFTHSLPPSHPASNLYFANNTDTVAALEDEGEHQVTVPESTNESIAGKIQLRN